MDPHDINRLLVIIGMPLAEWHRKHKHHHRESREITDSVFLHKIGVKTPDAKLITTAKIIICHDCQEIFVHDYTNDEIKL